MRIISKKRLIDFWTDEPAAKQPLRTWHAITKAARWRSFAETRKTFSHADQVRVKSGNTVTVFNVAGNKYRLITAVHYPRSAAVKVGKVFVLRVLTHSEYDRGAWKEQL